MATLFFNAIVGAWGGAALYLLRKNPGGVFLVGLLALGGGLALGAAIALVLVFELHQLFAPMRLLCWALFVHVPVFLAGAAVVLPREHRGLAAGAIAGALGLGSLGTWCFFIEPTWLEVTHHRVVTDRIRERVRIAIVSDLQTDDPGAYEREVLERTMAEEPDLVLFSGDYIQTLDEERRPELRQRLHGLLSEVGLEARLGAFAVRGNVDSPEWQEIFDGLPVTTVDTTRSYSTGELQITCLGMRDSGRPGVGLARSGRYHIVLGHRPGYALGDHQADLMIAGHTHGGQVRLPGLGPLITLSKVPRAWAAGLTWITPEQALLVSRGVGMERGHAPRLRFNCRPEVVIVDLVPAHVPSEAAGAPASKPAREVASASARAMAGAPEAD